MGTRSLPNGFVPSRSNASTPGVTIQSDVWCGLSVSEKRILWQRLIESTGFIASDEILEMLPPPSCFGGELEVLPSRSNAE